LKVDPGDPDTNIRQQRKERVLRKLQRVMDSMTRAREGSS
jgi:hypothetical protein